MALFMRLRLRLLMNNSGVALHGTGDGPRGCENNCKSTAPDANSQTVTCTLTSPPREELLHPSLQVLESSDNETGLARIAAYQLAGFPTIAIAPLYSEISTIEEMGQFVAPKRTCVNAVFT